jgi:hypothetical protein
MGKKNKEEKTQHEVLETNLSVSVAKTINTGDFENAKIMLTETKKIGTALSLKEKNGLLEDMFSELNDKMDELAETFE